MLWGLWDRSKAHTEPVLTVEAETWEEAKADLLARVPAGIDDPVVEPAPLEGRCHVGWYFSGPSSEPTDEEGL